MEKLSNSTKEVAKTIIEKVDAQELFKLPEINAMDAEGILKECITKKYLHNKYCKICKDKRHLGRDLHNSVEPCYRCVHMHQVKKLWRDYCLNKPEFLMFYFNEEVTKNEDKEDN